MNRTLFDITRSLIIDCTVPTPFWGEAIHTTCQIHNRLPSGSITNISPHQLWFGNAPTFKAFRRFGCIAYARALSIPRGAKVDPHGIRCCFLGYINISQGIFLLWDLQHGHQIQSRDVRFIEGQSPTHKEFINLPNCLAQLIIPAPEDPEVHMDPISIDDDEGDASSDDMELDNALPLAPIVDDTSIGRSGQRPRTPSEPRTPSDSRIASDAASDASSDGEDDDVDSAQRMDIDAPHTRTPSTPHEHETDPTIDDLATSSSTIIADPAEVLEPRSTVVDRPTPAPVRFSARLAERRGRTTRTIDDQPSVHAIYAVDPVDANPDPANIEDAISHWDHARWRHACHEELTRMDQYGTWTVVRRPKDITVVDTKCVLHIKNPSTKEERYKARIVARGFSMKPGEDYFDTHASVVKSTTIRILLSLAAALGMIVELADVETAYLNAPLHESIHAEQPPYFELKDRAEYVLLLKQALYGLPQSGFEWAATLLGEIHVSQADYIRRILKRFHMMDCNSVKTPAIAGMKLHIREEGEPTADANLYRQMVGSMMHAAVYTRPDIAFVANKLSQYNTDTSAAHMHAAKHLLRYLKRSIDLGITYSASAGIGDLTPITYADASYASDLDDSKSTTGYVIMLNGGAVSYRACKQGNVSLSSAEAEYVALCDAACDLVFVDKILSQLTVLSTYPLTIKTDAQSAIRHVVNNTKHTQMKHFAAKFNFIKDLYIKGKVALEHIPSEQQPADTLAKAHGPTMHNHAMQLLRMSQI
jgi:Reverse transcriptase (RNA-dependent DNA polymerase)